MMHRHTAAGLLCITQPTHAWVAGQIARAWGNERFGSFAPWEEVCLGAEQHDIGWLPWEAAPTLNPATGYPHSFTEIPTTVSIQIWTRAKMLAMPLGRYATLLVSMHGTGLFQRFTHWQSSAEATQLVQTYLTQEAAFQQRLIETLQADPHYAPFVTPEAIARNHKLVAIWDLLSILLCTGMDQPRQVEDVPIAMDTTSLSLRPVDEQATRITVDPWPFQANSVTLTVEGRLLTEPFTEESTLQMALNQAPWQTITLQLMPQMA